MSDGNSDDEIIRRKSRRRPLFENLSDSDSEADIGHKRKRVKAIVDSGTGSDTSSDGGSPLILNRRGKRLPKIKNMSSESSDQSGDENKTNAGFASDSSESAEKCPICLLSFKAQEIGTPESCEHVFCIDCITEWSKNVNTCPVDRITFNAIIVRACLGGRVLRKVEVETPPPVSSPDEIIVIENPTFCEICGSCEDETHMLLCDACDLGYHMRCLSPPLEEVPTGEWFCPECAAGILNMDDEFIFMSELDDLLTENAEMDQPTGPRPSVMRRQGTSRSSSRRTSQRLNQPSTSTQRNRRAAGNYRSNTISKRKKKSKKEKKIKRASTKTTRRARTAARRRIVRSRVREQLHRLHTNTTNNVSVDEISFRRYQAGIPQLNIFGNHNQLDDFSDDDGNYESGPVVVTARRPTSHVINAIRQARRKRVIIPSPPRTHAVTDIVSSIMESQAALHSKTSVISISVDGQVNITLQKQAEKRNKSDEKINLNEAEASVRKTPMYSGNNNDNRQSGNNYGNYREQTNNTNMYRGGSNYNNYENNYNRGNVRNFQGSFNDDNNYHDQWHANMPPPHMRRPDNYQNQRRRTSFPTGNRNFQQWPGNNESEFYRNPHIPSESALDMTIGPNSNTPVNFSGGFGELQPPPKPPTPPASFNMCLPDMQKSQDNVQQYDPMEPTQEDSSDEDKPSNPNDNQRLNENMNKNYDESDDDCEGDCPNFSIYSATSVQIANNDKNDVKTTNNDDLYDPEVDLVQEDDADEPPETKVDEPPPDKEYNIKIAKRCPITPSPRNPIKIKLNSTSLITKKISILHDDEEDEEELDLKGTDIAEAHKSAEIIEPEKKLATNDNNEEKQEEETGTPVMEVKDAEFRNKEKDVSLDGDSDTKRNEEKDNFEKTKEVLTHSTSEKMTESISESEDERSYTPCLDENKFKENSFEKDNECMQELGTEMISEDEGNELFSDTNIAESEEERLVEQAVTEIENKDERESLELSKSDNEIKSKEKSKTSKTKSKSKKKKNLDVKFKKLSKNSKQRNYRDKENTEKNKNKQRRGSEDDRAKSKKRREKRKDLERYDVRTVVTEKRRHVKDAFGRDTSRPRSPSPSGSHSSPRKSMSPALRGKSTTPIRNRSLSIKRNKSRSPLSIRRSPSPPPRRFSPVRGAHKRSPSPRHRRSQSLHHRRSASPRHRSPIRRRRFRRTPTPPIRRPPSVHMRKRRTLTPRRFSMSPRRRRSLSKTKRRQRRISNRSKSPKRKNRSLSRHRSPSPKPKKSRKTKRNRSNSPKERIKRRRNRKSKSVSPAAMPEGRQGMPLSPYERPMYQAWSPNSVRSHLMSPSWTPPPGAPADPRNLRVVVNNEERGRERRKKKDRDIGSKHKHSKEHLASKEVFTSGNNILVSVSFNKSDEIETGVSRKRKGRDKRAKKKKSKQVDENAKPVAIIDLENSPFKEITLSPKNIIILSDSDHGEKDKESQSNKDNQLNNVIANETTNIVNREPQFITGGGPKTPPEPTVKFTVATKPQVLLRAVNPLMENDNKDDGNEENTEVTKETTKGPNTPPNPPQSLPSSPDAYDPFEPTKSRSPSPAQCIDTDNNDAQTHTSEKTTITLEAAQKTNLSADDVVNQRPISPMEKVMALLNSTKNVSPSRPSDDIDLKPPTGGHSPSIISKSGQSFSNTPRSPKYNNNITVGTSAPIYQNIQRVGAFNNNSSPNVQATSQRIMLPSPKSSPLKSQPPKLFLAKPSPIKSTPIKPMPSKTIISKLPLPIVKPIVDAKGNKDPSMDVDYSPYSPGSSDFGDLFEPPEKISKSGKGDVFSNLFDSKKKKSAGSKFSVKRVKGSKKKQVGVKLDEDSLKVLDELPNSAVEMQVKSKFLVKLNRQERVVEEVKLVLKPHYNKKHVTKDEYKDILRKAVPKICHNKSGEINPAKIQALIEAYVKKYRKRRKLGVNN